MRTSNLRRGGRSAVAVIAALLGIIMLAGCGIASAPPGELGQDQKILASCPKDTQLASKVDLDVSGSSRTATLQPERAAVISDVARQTAICGGHLQVKVFSGTSAATEVLYDGELTLPGATDNARLRRVPGLVDGVIATVTQAYGSKVAQLDPGSSDIVAEVRLAREYANQLGNGYQLHLTLLTDGFQTAGFDLGGSALTDAQAAALADKVEVPKLPGAHVTVAGIGKVVDQPPSSAVVDGVIAFYNALCARTEAASCVSVTDYTPAGR